MGSNSDQEMLGLELCKYMGGWSWDDYLNTPCHIIDKLTAKMSAESKYQQKMAKKDI